MKQRHFVLVHGACHGAWCWYKVVSLLKSAGHKVTALDMAASGIHPTQAKEIQSILEYFQPLMEFLMDLPQDEKVILVAHSNGGLGISMAMENFPEKISAAVFVSAVMPGPQLSYIAANEHYVKTVDFMDTQYLFENGPNSPPTSLLLGPNCMSSQLYQNSSHEDYMLSRMLIRPHPLDKFDDIKKHAVFTKEKYGSISRIFIVCGEDNVFKEDLIQRWIIRNNPPNEVMVISDSDHMPMFSKPQEFCSCLQEVANKYL